MKTWKAIFFPHLLSFVFVRKLGFLLLRQVSPHLANDSTNLPKLQLWILVFHLGRKAGQGFSKAPVHQPGPKPSCCTAYMASRASRVLLEVSGPHELEVFWRRLVGGWRCCCRTAAPWRGWTSPRPAASEPSNNPVSLVRAKPCKAATQRWPVGGQGKKG